MSLSSERGSILAQVLVAVVFMAFLSASILRARLQPAMTVAAGVSRAGEDLAARAALARVTESWTRLGSCASDASAGIICTGSGCNCTCTVGAVAVTAVASGGACVLKAVPLK